MKKILLVLSLFTVSALAQTSSVSQGAGKNCRYSEDCRTRWMCKSGHDWICRWKESAKGKEQEPTYDDAGLECARRINDYSQASVACQALPDHNEKYSCLSNLGPSPRCN